MENDKEKATETKSPWWFIETLEGPSLILGRGFDYDAAIILDQSNQMIVIRQPYPSKETDESYPYPNMNELCLPIQQLRDLLTKEKVNEEASQAH